MLKHLAESAGAVLVKARANQADTGRETSLRPSRGEIHAAVCTTGFGDTEAMEAKGLVYQHLELAPWHAVGHVRSFQLEPRLTAFELPKQLLTFLRLNVVRRPIKMHIHLHSPLYERFFPSVAFPCSPRGST